MTKSTKLLIGEALNITDIGHHRTISTEQPPDIGHHRRAEGADQSTGTAVLELSEPQLVRRVKAYRDTAGNIHLDLEE